MNTSAEEKVLAKGEVRVLSCPDGTYISLLDFIFILASSPEEMMFRPIDIIKWLTILVKESEHK